MPLDRPLLLINKNASASDKKNVGILVGFYYNKYNAEQDLPTILLSDSILIDKVNADVKKDVYMKKQGFRINISPLSEDNALRVCEKIKALGELCEIEDQILEN